MRSFGEIYGYLFAIFILGSGAGPFLMGVSFDRTGSYDLMLECSVFALALASVLMLSLRAYPYPGRRMAARKSAERARDIRIAPSTRNVVVADEPET